MKISVFIFCLSLSFNAFANMDTGIQAISMAAGTMYLANTVVSAIEAEENEQICSGGQAWACGIAALAAVSVLANGDSANKSRNLATNLDCRTTNTCGGPNGGPGNPNDGSGTGWIDNPYAQELLNEINNTLIPQAKKTIADLKSKGIVADEKGVRLANGKRISSLTPEAFAAAGFSEAEQAIIEDVLKKMQKEHESILAKLKESEEEYAGGMGFDEGGGYEAEKSKATTSMSLALGQRNAQQQSVAGLSVNHGGDKIGVAAGNLFEMIHKAYQKNKTNLQP